MLGMLLAAAMILACLALIQVIKKSEIRKGLMTIDHTDIIKGASIFLIVVGHIGVMSGVKNLNPIGFASLAAFLVCSGVGLQKSYEKNGLKGFFRKRLIRIMIPYWIAVAAYFALNPSEFSLLNLAEALILIKPYEFWWFVQFIVISYVLFYLTYKFLPEKLRLPCLFLLSAVFFVLLRPDLQAAQVFSIPIGILISKYSSKKVPSNKKVLAISVLSIVLSAGLIAVKLLPPIHTSNYLVYNGFQVLISLFLAFSIIGLTYLLMGLFIVKMLAVAGRASYELYLSHTLLIFMLMGRATVLNVFIYVTLFGAVTVAFYFLNKLISNRISGKTDIAAHHKKPVS